MDGRKSPCFVIALSSASDADSLCLHLVGFTDDAVGCPLDDAARLGKLGPNSHKVHIDITSRLATFINAPEKGRLA